METQLSSLFQVLVIKWHCMICYSNVIIVVVINFLLLLGHSNRRGETVAMKRVMEGLGLTVVDMVNPATMDGGDVLFTGKEFFVGISTRTNKVRKH